MLRLLVQLLRRFLDHLLVRPLERVPVPAQGREEQTGEHARDERATHGRIRRRRHRPIFFFSFDDEAAPMQMQAFLEKYFCSLDESRLSPNMVNITGNPQEMGRCCGPVPGPCKGPVGTTIPPIQNIEDELDALVGLGSV